MDYPRIFLAIDNCFASKRWTRPLEWSKVIKDMGINFIEASADTELDPLFMGEKYYSRWVEEVKKAEDITDVKVVNLYSGHGTYSTLGLTHTDEDVRERMKNKWFKPFIRTAAELGAGIGFFAHAFPDFVLQDSENYNYYKELLYNNLSELNEYAYSVGCKVMGLEQMYTPHQFPWRIMDTINLLKEVTKRSGNNFYYTEDVGHHLTKFIMPSPEEISYKYEMFKQTNKIEDLWLGTSRVYNIFKQAESENGKISDFSISTVLDEMKKCPHMFAELDDGDCYEWIRRLGCYSPIIHLQQTNGYVSAHKHFTSENNEWGKIEPLQLLKMLKESYEVKTQTDMPERCENIYLTLEIFTSTDSINYETLAKFQESIDYWRKYIPKDGLKLDLLVGE